MLSDDLIKKVKNCVRRFWEVKAKEAEFVSLAQGKEIGHRIADYVDEKTTHFMCAHYEVGFERNAVGAPKMRSMGDLWLKDNSIYHPVNIKTGLSNSGQPNMVALRKLLLCILQNQIDSYYLLMVKFPFHNEKIAAPEVYFLDMLDCLEYLSFDSGPGQIMLKAGEFFRDADSFVPPVRDLRQKSEKLMEMLAAGDRQLFLNRKKKRERLEKLIARFENRSISTADQDILNLK